MLKSSSLCLYSSNLGTFWLKIEQSWPIEEISIFSKSQPNFAEMILRWSPFKIMSVSAVLYQRWPPLLKIEISSNGQNGYRMALKDTILKGDHLTIISAKFG
jgi:hypothetical protein